MVENSSPVVIPVQDPGCRHHRAASAILDLSCSAVTVAARKFLPLPLTFRWISLPSPSLQGKLPGGDDEMEVLDAGKSASQFGSDSQFGWSRCPLN